MNVQDYLLAVPYAAAWHLARKRDAIFYCTDPLDYVMWEPIQKHLPPLPVHAVSSKAARWLAARGVSFTRGATFPRGVVMARHKPYKFPVAKIRKVGFDHGLYQFKRWTSTKYYNGFDAYLMSSEKQVELARARGITTARAIGYPKLDRLFDGTIDEAFRARLRAQAGIDPAKKTVLLTSTWNAAGVSAIDRWLDRCGELAPELNVLATCHTWTAPEKIAKLKSTPGVRFLDDFDVTPWFSVVDVMVGDYNSLLGEFCALDRPIVTFRVPDGPFTMPDVKRMIGEISTRQVDDFDGLRAALGHALANPREKAAERAVANRVMHSTLDGKAGARAAAVIREVLEDALRTGETP